jgi:uncharacterized FlgJ-related protein
VSVANNIAQQLHVTTPEILALSALESSWGQSRFATSGNNYFGMHAPVPGQTGTMSALDDPSVKMATFANFSDSATAFANAYGKYVTGITNPTAFFSALQQHAKFGYNKDGTPVKSYAADGAGTVSGIASGLICPHF